MFLESALKDLVISFFFYLWIVFIKHYVHDVINSYFNKSHFHFETQLLLIFLL